MSKCLICGNELVTGDIHWEQGLCNVCWNKTFNKDVEVVGVDLIDIYKDKILILEQQLAEKDKEIERLKYLLLDKENKSTFFEQLYNQTIEDAKIVKDCGSFTALNKIIRHQVCDEIRDFIQKNESPSFSQSLCGYWFISAKKLFEYIDKIEQGE